MNCIACHRQLKDPKAIAEGIGPICRLKYKPDSTPVEPETPKVKLVFKSHDGIRSWLIDSKPRHLMRVTPIDADVTDYVCERGQCEHEALHIKAVKKAEAAIETAYQAQLAQRMAA